MGCGMSRTAVVGGKRRPSGGTMDSLDGELIPTTVLRRYGNPSSYKNDGYDFGLRIRVKGNKLSYYVASSKSTGDKFTIKEAHLNAYAEEEIVRETLILTELQHTCLPYIREIYNTETSVFLVMNYIDSVRLKNLIDLKNHKIPFTTEESKIAMKSIWQALQYCHEKKVIVRNLCPDQIMIRKTGESNSLEVKIADLSYAVTMGSSRVLADHPLFDWNDVPFYSPEALLGGSYDTMTDIWSAGILFYLLLSGDLPFYNEDDRILLHCIKHAEFDFSGPNWANVSSQARYLIRQILIVDPHERLSIKSTLKDKFMLQPSSSSSSSSSHQPQQQQQQIQQQPTVNV